MCKDIVDRDQLQAHAKRVGEYLHIKVEQLMLKKAGKLIGNIRGSGLFRGIEFVKDRVQKLPATMETSILCSRLKDDYKILTSIDGKYNNVLVIKPPLCFNQQNVDTLISAMEIILTELASETLDEASFKHTPT